MKVFISLKMNGRPDDEIQEDMNKALEILKEDEDVVNNENFKDSGTFEIVETLKHENIPKNASRLWYLGASIQKLADADIVYFYDNWWQAKGCWVEFIAANVYDKEIVYDYPNRRILRAIEDILRFVFSIMDTVDETDIKEDPNDV